VKVLPKEEFRDLPQKRLVRGFSRKATSMAPRHADTVRQTPNYPLGDLDEYRQGFLAGYSLTRMKRY